MIASAAFWSHWGWAAATAVLGFVFFQYVARRRLHQLAWASGLLFYAIAVALEAWSESSGEWDPTVYRIYIVLAASLVGFLGLGTLYLVARKRRWGDLYFVFLVACMVVFFVGTSTVELDMAKLVPGITTMQATRKTKYRSPQRRLRATRYSVPRPRNPTSDAARTM